MEGKAATTVPTQDSQPVQSKDGKYILCTCIATKEWYWYIIAIIICIEHLVYNFDNSVLIITVGMVLTYVITFWKDSNMHMYSYLVQV